MEDKKSKTSNLSILGGANRYIQVGSQLLTKDSRITVEPRYNKDLGTMKITLL